jgi:dihydroorotase
MKFDLLIRDGEVVDPGSGLRGRMDVGIAGGKIVEVASALREGDARRTISAKDRLVTPGFVDVHAHIFVNCSDMGENTDRLCNSSGVTTVCDAGSAGSANFAGLRFVVDKAVKTRARAFVNLSAIGIVGTARSGELAHFPYADPEGCARTIAENRDLAIGVKLRYGPGIVWEYTAEPVKTARRAADTAGVPLMIHITDTPLPLPEILAHMKPGDIITHCFHGRDHGIMGPEKAVDPERGRRSAASRDHLRLRPWAGWAFQFPADRKGARPGISAGHDLDRSDLHDGNTRSGLRSDDDNVEAPSFRGEP